MPGTGLHTGYPVCNGLSRGITPFYIILSLVSVFSVDTNTKTFPHKIWVR